MCLNSMALLEVTLAGSILGILLSSVLDDNSGHHLYSAIVINSGQKMNAMVLLSSNVSATADFQ